MHDHNHQCACGHHHTMQMNADNTQISADESKHECRCGHCESSAVVEQEKVEKREGCCGGTNIGACVCGGCCEEEKE